MTLPTIKPGNIWSGSKTLAVFTNPTELAYRKGNLKHHYPIIFNGKKYPDVEEAYQTNKFGSLNERGAFITELIIIKLKTYPIITATIIHNGGIDWLRQCSHWTSAKSKGFKAWEGDGEKSLFIRCLIKAYEVVVNEYRANKNDQNIHNTI